MDSSGTGTVYRIAKWTETFERAESRKLKQLTWIAMPVGFSSTGYQAMLEDFDAERAPAIYGAWCALCAYAASCHVRGTLGNSRGIPLKISHVARITGFAESVFRDLFAWASREDIGWLEAVPAGEIAQEIADQAEKLRDSSTSGESPDNPPTPQGNPPSTRPDRTEQDRTGPDQTVPDKTRRSNDWTSAGFEFRESVRETAASMSEMQARGIRLGLSRDEIWRIAWVGTDFDKAGLLDALARCREHQVDKPKGYLGMVMVRMCQARGESWDELKLQVPPPPPPPPKPGANVAPQMAAEVA
jgi:hypothetical protein